ncbi:MAG: alkaline phosphatase PhoX [Myxococcota bacterium]
MPTRKLIRSADESRRQFLRKSFAGAGWIAAGGMLSRCGDNSDSGGTGGSGGSGGAGGVAGTGGAGGTPPPSNIATLGPLQDPDENGLRLPEGFTSRIIAQAEMEVASTGHIWHSSPDGGAVYTASDGGWVYVSNSETLAPLGGGVGAVRFSSTGDIVDAYRILADTNQNCAGGPTPWDTWLSCEERPDGRVWECDPFGMTDAVVREALGVFEHEAVAVDPVTQNLYLTEDEGDGRFYRFVPDGLIDGMADLSAGTLQVAEVMGGGPEGTIEWRDLSDPSAASGPTRLQVPSSTPFDGGEGIWYFNGVVYFTTKGDDRVWALETASSELTLLYDRATSSNPILSGVDNVTVSPSGDVLVAEDGGNMEIVALTPDGTILPLVEVVGQDSSEITGPAFSPGFDRLYFSSQRGFSGNLTDGITYEVSGPFGG